MGGVALPSRYTRQSSPPPSQEAARQAKREAKKSKPVGHISFYEAGRREKLVERGMMEKEAFARARQVRDGLLNIPDRIAGILAAEPDQARIHAMLTKELQQCLEGLMT